jgi:hypothetical protein
VLDVSAQFLEAIRNPPPIAVRLEAWRAGARVDTYGDDGIPIYAGEVQVDGTKAIQRSLSGLRVDATDEMWDLLSPVGTQLRAYRGFRYGPGRSELVPAGWFAIETLTENYGGDWDGSVESAPDLMWLVERARFLNPRTFPAGTRIATMISTLLSEILGSVTVTATSLATLPSTVVLEQDRLGEIQKAAESIGAIVYVNASGTPVLADAPTIQPAAVWDVDTGDAGVLYTAARSRSADRAYSAVKASAAQVDGVAQFAPQVVYDDNPDSPTYHLGPFGLVPYFMSSDKFQTAAQALAAAQARLPLVTATRAEFDLTAECNPALEAWDTIAVHLPRRQRGQTTVTERHMVSAFTIPLTPDGVQSISTRSSVADLPSE